MANCDSLFKRFYSKIILTESKQEDLRSVREALRGRIRAYFKNDLNEAMPFFHGQGSFYMKTIINPLPDKKYDIDDGVYLQNLPSRKLDWPTAQTAHNWIYDAVKGHTEEDPIDKGPCIRVIYATDYHVDLAIYGISDQKAYLAEKNEGKWIESDPKAFADWFNNKIANHGEQLRRVICYLKAWADNQSSKMLKGVAFTISATNNFEGSQFDDECLVKTAAKMSIALKKERQIKKPVVPYENLLAKWTKEELDGFISRFDLFILNGVKALAEKDKSKAIKIWIGEFGDRFPELESDKLTESTIERWFTFPYEKLLSYIENLKHRIKITAKVSNPEQGSAENYSSGSRKLPKGWNIRFSVDTNHIPKPHNIIWQPVNSGREAESVGCMRGELINDEGSNSRNESLAYSGTHYMKCYVIRDGKCVAKDRFTLRIK
jgi:hypothetical protein